MTVVLVASGALLIAAALVDVVWTTVAAGSGAGPITSRLARSLWRLALTVHTRRPSHALLSFSGVAVVLAVLTSWITLALAGWALVFSAAEGGVRATTSEAPASLVGRLYFTGYTVFTLGNGDYVPGDGAWQLATVLAVATGLRSPGADGSSTGSRRTRVQVHVDHRHSELTGGEGGRRGCGRTRWTSGQSPEADVSVVRRRRGHLPMSLPTVN